jgi:signal transduction histidine kinase/CheY-like chemotaxis protein
LRSSLSRNFLLGLGATSIVLTLAASLSAFAVFQQDLERRQTAFLSQYVQERASNVSHRFSPMMELQRSAGLEIQRRLNWFHPGDADGILDKFMPLKPDGTRRSRPEAFEGFPLKTGGFYYGMGAFIADGRHIPELEKRALAASFSIVASFGKASQGTYDNFYFYTPHNRVVIFGPNRPDHLMFYRHDAPADLDFSHEEMSRFILPDVNPLGETRCTSLQAQLQDRAKRRVSNACMTPVYIKGQLVGAFGSTIQLTQMLSTMVKTSLPGAESLVARSDGALLAYPGGAAINEMSEAAVAGYEQRTHLRDIVSQIAKEHKDSGVIVTPDHRDFVAYGWIQGPGWYLLIRYPTAAVAWSAARSAFWILVCGLGFSVLQTLAILLLSDRTIVRPLRRLAESCVPGAADSATSTGRLERRNDEIGVLARALRDERARADDLLSSLEQRVLDRTAELERANTEKSRFLANMSHELRTPLNGVIAVSERLAAEQITDRNRELAELIVSSGRLLEQVLTDILDFSKIEAGEMRLEAGPMVMQTLVSRVAELHQASAEAKGVILCWDVDPEASGAYVGDEVRLTQVLSNLLSNAVKFTEAGRVDLRVEGLRAGGVRFTVKDTGIGFDDEVKARLFNRFEQADVSIRRRFGGTGLGLAICRSLVELMGGAIEADATPGAGACFTFVLPLLRVQADSSCEDEEVGDAFDLTGVRVLLAEDHPTNQRVVRLILETVGIDLAIVDNGKAALEALAADPFDLVLMDMQMPELDGLSATQQIRADETSQGAARIPIIMLTANALGEHVRASLEAGADLHVSKPIRAEALLSAIAGVLLAAANHGATEDDSLAA